MMWYKFNQSNPGGSHMSDSTAGIAVNVYVEAFDAEQANDRAERIGIYFDGVDDGYDCSCCNDRWYRVDDYDSVDDVPGPNEPFVIDDNTGGYNPIKWLPDGDAETYVHPLDKPFYATHQKLNHIKRKTTGYGLYFSQYDVGDIVSVADDGWDQTGNFHAPAPGAKSYLPDDKIINHGNVRIQQSKSVIGTSDNFTAWSRNRSALEQIQNNMLKYIDSIPEFDLQSIVRS